MHAHAQTHKYRGKRCPCTYISILQTHIDLYIRIHAVQSTKRWTRYQKLRPTLMSFAKSVRFFPHMAVADQPKLIRTKSSPPCPQLHTYASMCCALLLRIPQLAPTRACTRTRTHIKTLTYLRAYTHTHTHTQVTIPFRCLLPEFATLLTGLPRALLSF